MRKGRAIGGQYDEGKEPKKKIRQVLNDFT